MAKTKTKEKTVFVTLNFNSILRMRDIIQKKFNITDTNQGFIKTWLRGKQRKREEIMMGVV
jgi:hypothetical protein